jgi:hypothetical protein
VRLSEVSPSPFVIGPAQSSSFLITRNLSLRSVRCHTLFKSINCHTHCSVYLGTEIWNVDKGRMTHKGKASVVEDAFADAKLAAKSGANTPAKSGVNTPAKSRNGTPAASAGATPAGSGGEGTGSPMPKKKTKKLTRNQLVLCYKLCGQSLMNTGCVGKRRGTKGGKSASLTGSSTVDQGRRTRTTSDGVLAVRCFRTFQHCIMLFIEDRCLRHMFDICHMYYTIAFPKPSVKTTVMLRTYYRPKKAKALASRAGSSWPTP